jgi:hypothetical protein
LAIDRGHFAEIAAGFDVAQMTSRSGDGDATRNATVRKQISVPMSFCSSSHSLGWA